MKILITGGCGFIGCNAAARFAQLGHQVTLLDNLSRPCTDLNLAWLQANTPARHILADIRNRAQVEEIFKSESYDVVLHLAAQVAVTTSVTNPREDFEINALGTFNMLDALRRHRPETVFLNASTNKVYGKLSGATVVEEETRYALSDREQGVAEIEPLDFYSPYGCSKGTADQYTVDFARIYGLRTVNFRQSCIYGARQFGVEDQGWVAWFTIAHEFGKPITLYGNGKQVRDLLYVEDMVEAYLKAIERIDQVTGQSFNLGGGRENALSILEFFELLGQLSARRVVYNTAPWRSGDQPVFISDNRKAEKLLEWRPRVPFPEGLRHLRDWVLANRSVLTTATARL